MEFKRIKRKTAGLIAAAALAAAMTTGAYAQNVVDDIIDGAENIVDDTGDAAENILGGNDNDANDKNNAGNADNANNVDDVPGDRENAAADNANRADANPVTGAGFFDAAITAVTAAGIAYITRRRNRMLK